MNRPRAVDFLENDGPAEREEFSDEEPIIIGQDDNENEIGGGEEIEDVEENDLSEIESESESEVINTLPSGAISKGKIKI